tara:strand:+ start:360 stop:659 length:300 start_codon:yes stop_codon:yes gene_type:complete
MGNQYRPRKTKTRDFQINGETIELKASLAVGDETPSVIAFTPEISIRCAHCDSEKSLNKFAHSIVAALEIEEGVGYMSKVIKTKEVIEQLSQEIGGLAG